jgi:hypothetical protein
LEKETATARLEQERLKAQLSWRTIPPNEIARLGTLLATSPSEVILDYTTNDPEALFLAIQLSKAFEAAKWTVTPRSYTYGSQIVFGLRIPDSANTALTNTLRNAFATIGVPFGTENVPTPEMAFTYGGSETAPLVFIGSKPPPF